MLATDEEFDPALLHTELNAQVFRSNEASLGLWRSLGFTELAVVPKAGRLKGIDGLVSTQTASAQRRRFFESERRARFVKLYS